MGEERTIINPTKKKKKTTAKKPTWVPRRASPQPRDDPEPITIPTDEFPGAGVNVLFGQREQPRERNTNEGKLEASRQIACFLALHDQDGFGHLKDCAAVRRAGMINVGPGPDTGSAEDDIAMKTLYRFALLANFNLVPRMMVQCASGCGGVKVQYGQGSFGPTCPNAGDLGNHNYKYFVKRLLEKYEALQTEHRRAHGSDMPIPNYARMGLAQLHSTQSPEKLGDVVEACLAAADAALCLQEFQANRLPSWKRRFVEIQGGGHAHGDVVTDYIQRRADYVVRFGCECQDCARAGRLLSPGGPPY